MAGIGLHTLPRQAGSTASRCHNRPWRLATAVPAAGPSAEFGERILHLVGSQGVSTPRVRLGRVPQPKVSRSCRSLAVKPPQHVSGPVPACRCPAWVDSLVCQSPPLHGRRIALYMGGCTWGQSSCTSSRPPAPVQAAVDICLDPSLERREALCASGGSLRCLGATPSEADHSRTS